jgi:hypothetical protein
MSSGGQSLSNASALGSGGLGFKVQGSGFGV